MKLNISLKDARLLQEVLAETCYAAEIRAILLIAQKLRFNSDAKSLYGKKAERPKQELSQWSSTIRKILSECEIEEPSADEVQKTLETYQMFSEQEIKEMIAEL